MLISLLALGVLPQVLLLTDKAGNTFSDRTMLKSLGHWLGMLTLSKNRPLLHIDIALKDLLLEAYLKGQQELLYVVPFVAKVLECSADSKVFKPPNPWVMAIMSVLTELHAKTDLKVFAPAVCAVLLLSCIHTYSMNTQSFCSSI